jgi:hypothetical protein
VPAPKNPDVRVPTAPPEHPPRREAPRPRRRPPVRVPVASALQSLLAMAGRPVSLVAGAAADARTAAMRAEPEPVLGAPPR